MRIAFLGYSENCATLLHLNESTKELLGFNKNKPNISRSYYGRYETVRKFYLVLDKTVASQQVKLDKYSTIMKDWYWKLEVCDSFLKKIGSDKRQTWCNIRKVKYLADYECAIAVFEFHRQAFDHANEEKRPKSKKKKKRDRAVVKKILKSTTEISEELFRVYPDFLPKFFHEFIMNIYNKTRGLGECDIDVSVSELVDDLTGGAYMGIVS
ncbi:uncharacterized protein LOC132270997 [Cornus florida]|uniref:uncharacterized protein LOC132270997 n=1 Tax=Cornus florida TaxID=4283 RepID=UPI0028A00195|nr:uncharacterized protein LOC132270997 [Cornus florida]